ncbi:MAG: DUF4922 domain-containing protein, partial [Syntrophales bacterium]|nr:DUF4922 domain-containing protein [Syntrophales bacterium]
PAIYYRPEGERMVISPGAVEMGGMFVTVTEGDFTALNARTVQAIYEEVAIDAGTLREMIPGL